MYIYFLATTQHSPEEAAGGHLTTEQTEQP